jgi:hypothetical protein
MIYTDASGADGTSESLNRIAINRSGNDPFNFIAAPPTPGVVQSIQPGDRDQDGMPDDWERANGLNPDDPADAARDLDSDGLTNLAEFRAGTDPASSASRLALNVAPSGSSATLTVQAVPGKSYSILVRDDLTAGAWQKLQDVTGSGAVSVTDPASGQRHRYYRVVTPAQP